MIFRRTATSIVGLMLICGCRPAPSPDALAVWDQGEATVADLDRYLMSQPPALRTPPDGGSAAAWLEDRLLDVFVRKMLIDSVDATALEADPTFSRGLELGTRALLAREFLRSQNAVFSVTNDEAREFFEANIELWRRPESRAFRHILIAPARGGDAGLDEACHEAEDLRRTLLAGASFEETARIHSDSANAAAGGTVSPITRTQLRPEIGRIVFALEPGEISNVVRTPAGCQIFQVAQIVNKSDPAFELVRDRIVQEIASQRRNDWRRELLAEQATLLGIEVPEWIAGQSTAPQEIDGDDVLLAIGAKTVTGRDVAARVQAGTASPRQAAADLTSELVFSEGLLQQNRGAASPLIELARREALFRFASNRSFEEYLANLDPGVWREHYEAHRVRFVREPRVAMSLYSWPINPGDPLDSLDQPKRFAAELTADGSDPETVWRSYADRPQVEREVIPETDLRVLVQTRPVLSNALLEQVAPGDVIGPYRHGNRLWIASITSSLGPAELGFDEAKDMVRADMLAESGRQIRNEWRAALAEHHGYRILRDQISEFDRRLLERLQTGPSVPTPPL